MRRFMSNADTNSTKATLAVFGLFHCQVVSVVSYFIECKEPLSTGQDNTTMVSDVRFQQICKGYSEQIAIKSLLKTANGLVFH